MLLLDRRLAYEELSRLAVMVGEAFRTHSLFGTVGGLRETGEATNRVLARSALRRAPAIGFIVHTALGIAHRHVPVLLEVRHRAFRSEEHTSELQSLMLIPYAVFCLKKKKT